MKSICITKEQGQNVLTVINKEYIDSFESALKIKVAYCGVCGTDLKLINGKYPISNELLPLTIGHEFVGIIEEVRGNSQFKVNDWVVGMPTLKSCEKCIYCKTGKVNLCKERLRLGINTDGIFSEYVSLPEKSLIKVDFLKCISTGIWLEPISVVARGVHTLRIHPGMKVAIAGPGPIGIITAMMLKEYGVSISMFGLENDKKIMSYLKDDEIIEEYSISTKSENKFDLSIDCTGNESAINNLLEIVKPASELLLLGTNKEYMHINFSLITYKELEVKGTIGANEKDWKNAIGFLKRHEKKLSKFMNILTFDEAVEKIEWRNELKVKNVIKIYEGG